MKVEVVIGGRGGQGILFAGYLLGYSAVKYLDKYVVQTQTYGAETRGGESVSELIIGDSEEDVEQLVVRKADVGIFMYQSTLNSYSGKLRPDCILIIDKDLVTDIPEGYFKVEEVPALRLAEEVGSPLSSNMVMLGAFSAITKVVELSALERGLRDLISGENLKANLKALRKGYEYYRERSV